MDREQVHETINQLVEAYHAEPQARERLTDFMTTNERPLEPDQFPNLVAFLNFHDERRRYDDTLLSLRREVANLEVAHKDAEQELLRILPPNRPLYYDYEGERQDLTGMQFKIVNQHRTIMISPSGQPSQ
jgi:hypothetical protein